MGDKFEWKGQRSPLQADLGLNVTSTNRCSQTPCLTQDACLLQPARLAFCTAHMHLCKLLNLSEPGSPGVDDGDGAAPCFTAPPSGR